MTLSYEPVNPFLLASHGFGGVREPPAKRLRAVKSYASILPSVRGITERLEDVCTQVYSTWRAERDPDLGQFSSGMSQQTAARNLEHLSLQRKLDVAESYEAWEEAALRLDEFEGHNAWKSKEDELTVDYDVKIIKDEIAKMERIKRSGDLKDMLMYMRTSLHRDLAGIGNPRLYRQSRIGTKELVEQYIDSTVDLIETTVRLIATSPHLPWSVDKMREMWLQTRQAYGRSALLLSGGGTLGMCHVGVVKALFEAGALPRIISGTSAGSIIASVYCVKTTEEVPDLLRDFCYNDLDVFVKKEDEDKYFATVTRHVLTEGNLYDISNLVRVMKTYLGDLTFLEAYNKTNKILNICVSNEDPREHITILNYVTAPNVLIWSAVAASCSVPLIYASAKLYEKHPRTGEMSESSQKWIDGSVNGDLPMERLSELFDVNHFIVSQVNPHIMPFITRDDDTPSQEDQTSSFHDGVFGIAKNELVFRLRMLTELGVFPTLATRVRSILGQTYQGDINILPQMPRASYLRVLLNPSSDFMEAACDAGEKATWPKINRIRGRCAIENAIDRAVKEACDHAEFSGSKVDLRRNVYHEAMPTMNRQDTKLKSHGKGESHTVASGNGRAPHHRTKSIGHRSTKSLHERVPVQWDEPIMLSKEFDNVDTSDEDDSSDSTIMSRDATLSKDESEQIMSDTELESSPSPPASTSAWAGINKIAGFRSQPVTPSLASKNFLSPTNLTPVLPMTPVGAAKRLSPQEATYKRIFHGKKPMSPIESPQPRPVDKPAAGLPRRNSKFGLNLSLKSGKAKGGKKVKGDKSGSE